VGPLLYSPCEGYARELKGQGLFKVDREESCICAASQVTNRKATLVSLRTVFGRSCAVGIGEYPMRQASSLPRGCLTSSERHPARRIERSRMRGSCVCISGRIVRKDFGKKLDIGKKV